MVGIAAHTKTDQLGVNLRAAFFRVLVLFEYDNARAVAQHKTIPFFIPRTACRLRVIVTGGERTRRAETADAKRRTGFFRAACEHNGSIAVGDDARRMANVVYA